MQKINRKAICLFSSAGIGELGIQSNEIDVIISNELLQERHDLYQRNYPKTKSFCGDIRSEKKNILSYYKEHFGEEELFLIYATPPCQGMSTNGVGKLLYEVKQGNRSAIDERNRLIIPAMDIITEVRPLWVLLENVPGMQNTVIADESGNNINVIEYIQKRLGSEYVGRAEVVACEDYGIPQMRKRLITIYTRDTKGIEYYNQNLFTFFPETGKKKKVTLKEAIGHLPILDSRTGFEKSIEFHPLHYVPVMKDEKHWWITNTSEGDTAYNNQCVNQECKFKGNPLHQDVSIDGSWKSNKSTPIYCSKCNALLPRPSMIDKSTGERRLIKGFHSAYRRMKWDRPAHTLTQNFQFEASDNKIHPEQNRVLSILEALIIQTISEYKYFFEINGKNISKSMFAEIIGESVPPKLIEIICTRMIYLSAEVLSVQAALSQKIA